MNNENLFPSDIFLVVQLLLSMAKSEYGFILIQKCGNIQLLNVNYLLFIACLQCREIRISVHLPDTVGVFRQIKLFWEHVKNKHAFLAEKSAKWEGLSDLRSLRNPQKCCKLIFFKGAILNCFVCQFPCRSLMVLKTYVCLHIYEVLSKTNRKSLIS